MGEPATSVNDLALHEGDVGRRATECGGAEPQEQAGELT